MPTIKNILIADDERAVLGLFRNLLQNEDYRLFFAADGEEAVDVSKREMIDLAVLDLVMPNMGGLEALKEIKKLDEQTEVLIITGNAELDGLEKVFFEYGVFDYLIKPFDMTELKLTIKRALHNRDLVLRNSNENMALKARIVELEKDFKEKVFRLRESQIKYKNIVNNSTDAIIVIQNGLLKFANKRFQSLTGYAVDETLNIPFLNLLHAEDCSPVFKKASHEDMTSEFLMANRKFRLRKKDESFLWVDNRMVGTTWENIPATLCFLDDISQKRHMEEMMVRSEKMASLGQLSSGLFHELRNPLAVISSCSQFCLENTDIPAVVSENFEVIFRNSQRANKLIKELLAFARPDQRKWKSVDLNELCENMLRMAKMGMLSSGITFVKEFEVELPHILGDEERLGQVLINLIQNAIQAVSERGTITLKTGRDPGMDPMLELSVSDNGAGILPENRKRIFDPFFTTKDSGTGLGLSICEAIITQHQGLITVECGENGGSRFIVKLPLKSE